MVSSSSDTNEATSLLRFTLPPIPDLPFPPAPRIVNAQLERQVFTHSSLLKKRRQASSLSLEEPIEDNEKLEHVGDSIIGEARRGIDWGGLRWAGE
jgi:dsRNA-specific ribonuclease